MKTQSPPIWADTLRRNRCIEHLTMFVEMLEKRIPYLKGKSHRMIQASALLGKAIEFTNKELYSLKLSAAFHDLGLLEIPDKLLLQEHQLNSEQKNDLLSKHIGLNGRLIGKAFPDFPEAAEGIWYHHERPDGTGPYKLKENEIPITAAIIGLLEAVDSMANGRPWRMPLSFPQIQSEINKYAGTQFSRKVVAIFQRIGEQIYEIILKEKYNKHEISPKKQNSNTPKKQSRIDSHPNPETSRTMQPNGSHLRNASLKYDNKATLKALNSLPKIVSKEELIQTIINGLNLKPLASNVHNLMSITQNPYCSTEEVAKEIILDQAMSIRILKLANSSAYARGKRVTGIKPAISRIGIQTVRKLVMSLDILKQYEGIIAEYIDIKAFWEHSIACGLIASKIGKALQSQFIDDYFLWGVLHDVGRLILIEHIPEKYVEIYKNHRELGLPLNKIEQKQIGIDHCDILKIAMEHWKFPKEFINPVVNHHYPVSKLKLLRKEELETSATIALANMISHSLLLGTSGNEIIYPFDDFIDLLNLSDDLIEHIFQDIPGETNVLKVAMLSDGISTSWPDCANNIKSKLETEFKPIFLSYKPETNSFRIFFEQIADSNVSDTDEPNIAVFYLHSTDKFMSLQQKFNQFDKNFNTDSIPFLIIYSNGKFDESMSCLTNRHHAVIKAPVIIDELIAIINKLLIT